MVRIIGGSARGIALAAPAGMSTRPTLGRVRESIFNVLANVGLVDTKVLDVFAGTGAMGLEALSRGAREAVLIDQATGRLIRENARKCRMEKKARILTREAGAAIRGLSGETFDYIFLDPPYRKGYINQILDAVIRTGLPADQCIIIAEHIVSEPPDMDQFQDVLSVWKEKRVGETAVTYLLYNKA